MSEHLELELAAELSPDGQWKCPDCGAESIDEMAVEHSEECTYCEEKFISLIEGMRISNRGNVGIGSGKSKHLKLTKNELESECISE